MHSARVIAVGVGCLLAGCGTLLDIQPDTSAPDADGGMTPLGDASRDADDRADGAMALDAADTGAPEGGPKGISCAVASPSQPCVVADNLVNLGSIAVANGKVYFTRHETAGAILEVPTTGGTPTVYAPTLNLPAGLSATDTALYWVTEGDNQVVRQLFASATPEPAANNGTAIAAHIVGTLNDTYWTVPGVGTNGGHVQTSMTTTLNSGAPIGNTETMPTAIALDFVYVYHATKTTAGHVIRFAHNGTDISTSAKAFNDITGVALASSHQTVAICSASGVWQTSTIANAAFTDGWAQTSTNTKGVGIVIDDVTGKLYVLTSDGFLEVIEIADGGVPIATKAIVSGCTTGRELVQDASYVYCACKDSIIRVQK